MKPMAIVALLSVLAAAPAVAQSLGGSPVSFGADIGLFAPFESGASSSFTGRVTAVVHSWSPLGLRFALGFANPTIGDGPLEDRFNTIYLSARLIRAFSEGSSSRAVTLGSGSTTSPSIGLGHSSGSPLAAVSSCPWG